MGLFKSTMSKTPKASLGVLGWMWKHKFWIILILILLPSIIQSIQYAVETSNPTYPFFQLATRIFTADNVLEQDVLMLQTDPVGIIGMAKPDTGIWLHFVYYWKLWWNVIYKIIGNVWLIFFPLFIIQKLVLGRNTSERWKSWWIATIIFLFYLFVTKTIILIHGVVSGNTLITLPEGLDTWQEYFALFKHTLPFKGLYTLFKYLVIHLTGV